MVAQLALEGVSLLYVRVVVGQSRVVKGWRRIRGYVQSTQSENDRHGDLDLGLHLNVP